MFDNHVSFCVSNFYPLLLFYAELFVSRDAVLLQNMHNSAPYPYTDFWCQPSGSTRTGQSVAFSVSC